MRENQQSPDTERAIAVKTVRRAPRYGRFITIAVLLAVVAAAILSQLPVFHSLYKRSDIFWVLIISLVPTAVLIATAIAVFLDRRSIASAERQSLTTAPTAPTEPTA